MDIRTQSSLLAGVVSLALAGSMLLRPRLSRGRALTLFSLLCLSLAAWYLADFVSVLSPRALWLRLGLAAGALVPLSALSFFSEFLGLGPGEARAQRVAVGGTLAGLAVAATPLFAFPVAVAGAGLWAFATLGLMLWLLRGRERAALARLEQERLLYLLLGAAIVVALSALDFVARYGHPWPTLGGVTTTIYLFFLAQTLQRHRLLDLHELLAKAASVSALALMLALVYGVIGFWLKDRPGLFLFNTVIASFVILSLYEPLRAKVEEGVLASLFRERFELVRTLGLLRSRLDAVITPQQMAELVTGTLHDSRRVTHTSVYLLAEDRPGFRLLDQRGPPPVAFLEAGAARGLLASAAAGERALLLEVVDRRLTELARAASPAGPSADPEAARLENVKSAMALMCSGITFPLVAGERVLGFWNLWDDRVPEAYGSDEIAAMLEVAERAASVIESSQLFERMKERDRLAALGEMAAGLAHEIRNPLGAIKGAAQYLDPRQLPGEEGDLLHVIIEEVDRLNGVVTEFLDYSRPIKSQLAPTHVNDVLAKTVKLLQSQGLPSGIEVDLRLSPELPPAIGDAEQLKQVFINLVLNAIQAMPHGGKLSIWTVEPTSSATWRFADVGPGPQRKARGPDFMEIHFRDTGEGIPPEARARIFIPFYTTKEKGTGLGLAIVQRIVKAHNGAISVDSEPGHGTEFVVRLPAATDLTPAPVNRASDTPRPPLLTALAAGSAASSASNSPGTPGFPPRRDRRPRRRRSR